MKNFFFKLFAYEGKDGDLLEEIGVGCEGGKAHKGGIYGVRRFFFNQHFTDLSNSFDSFIPYSFSMMFKRKQNWEYIGDNDRQQICRCLNLFTRYLGVQIASLFSQLLQIKPVKYGILKTKQWQRKGLKYSVALET